MSQLTDFFREQARDGRFVAFSTGMKVCPDCRTPVYSLMFLDKKLQPEFYCERCFHAVDYADLKSPVSPALEPVLA